MSIRLTTNYILLVCTVCVSCVSIVSCGFVYEKRIIGKYYIIGVDTKDDLGLSYSLGGGSFVGKAPGQLIEYGFNDTFLVAKTMADRNSATEYYVIDMTKDSEYAQEKDFRIGPMSEAEYKQQLSRRLNIKFLKVRSQ